MVDIPTIDVITSLKQARVLCVGDIMLDRFISGSVDRISPEAPVPVFRAEAVAAILGGAGNVARNIVALGATVCLVAAVGEDDSAGEIAKHLEAEPSIEAELVRDPRQPTTLKSRYVATGNHILRIDTDPYGPLESATLERIEAAFGARVAQAGAIIVSDYGKGVLPPATVSRLIAEAKASGIPVIVDPKGNDYGRYRGATLVTPNRKELAEAVGRRLESEAELIAAAESLIAAFDLEAVLVTRSEEGMSLISKHHPPRHFGTEAAEVYDVAGAGDTVVAVLAAGLAGGLPMDVSVALSNVAAGIVVRKTGTAVAYQRELRIALRERDASQIGKRVEIDDCLDLVEHWRSNGLRVGFTNGCFDVLHAGHIELLRKSKGCVDKLILGLNADSSVRGLKGEQRPVNSEDARARVLSAIEHIDAIVLFSESTPERLIEAIRPDVLMKGSDYSEDAVVGGAFVKQYGGEVRLIDLVEGYSSTAIINKLKGSSA